MLGQLGRFHKARFTPFFTESFCGLFRLPEKEQRTELVPLFREHVHPIMRDDVEEVPLMAQPGDALAAGCPPRRPSFNPHPAPKSGVIF